MHSELLANQGLGAQGFNTPPSERWVERCRKTTANHPMSFNTPPSERWVESHYDFRCQWVCPSTLKALLSFGIFPVFIANTF